MGSTFRYSGDELYHYGRSIKDGAPGVGTGNWRRSGGSSKKDKDVDERIYALTHPGESVKKVAQKVASSKVRIAQRISKASAKASKAYSEAKTSLHKSKMETLKNKAEEQEARNKLIEKQIEGERIQSEADRQEAKNQREDARQQNKDDAEAKKKQTEEDAKDKAKDAGANIWKEWSNDELQAYITRQNLENQADSYRMKQLDRPRQFAYEAIGYAKLGVDIMNTFTDITNAYNSWRKPNGDQSYSQSVALETLNTLKNMPMDQLKETDFVKDLKETLDIKGDYLSSVQRIESAAKGNQIQKNGGNQNQNNQNKQNNQNQSNQNQNNQNKQNNQNQNNNKQTNVNNNGQNKDNKQQNNQQKQEPKPKEQQTQQPKQDKQSQAQQNTRANDQPRAKINLNNTEASSQKYTINDMPKDKYVRYITRNDGTRVPMYGVTYPSGTKVESEYPDLWKESYYKNRKK